ncbi:hypothetical protein ABEY65_28035 [Priestia aryabhattai]|uniref:hypothetical protein n=1 Tax=Priestia aryabhattai TaxID=412384 RepID=UPI003D2D8D15
MKKKQVRVRKNWTARQKTGLIILAFIEELVELYHSINKLAFMKTKRDRRIFWTILTGAMLIIAFLWVRYIRTYTI